jgi:addiction module HigA family antidote
MTMATYKAKRNPDRAPVHPGAVLRQEVLPALNMPVAAAARHLGVSRQVLHRILAEKLGVSPAMAVRLGKFCGNGPNLWLNMQKAYDLWYAEKEVDVAAIPTMNAA